MSLIAKMPLGGVYVLTDAQLIPVADFIETVELALRNGVKILQYRDKSTDHSKRLRQAQALKELCSHYTTPLIINDDVQLARQVQADGVHLGRNDSGIADARAVLGTQAIIGISCYNQLEQAQQAQAQGADYVAFGSFYPSSTKPQAVHATPDLLRAAKATIKVPIVAIGGIEPNNAQILLEAGADFLAVISGIFAKPDIKAAAETYQALFQHPQAQFECS